MLRFFPATYYTVFSIFRNKMSNKMSNKIHPRTPTQYPFLTMYSFVSNNIHIPVTRLQLLSKSTLEVHNCHTWSALRGHVCATILWFKPKILLNVTEICFTHTMSLHLLQIVKNLSRHFQIDS